MPQMTQNDINEESQVSRTELTLEAINYLNLRTKNKVTSYTEEVKVHCPFHKDNTPSLFINVKHGIFKCFSCGRKGSIESLFNEMTGENIYKVLGYSNYTDNKDQFVRYANRLSKKPVVVSEPEDLNKKKSIYVVYNPKDFVPAYSNTISARYLMRRGITREVAEANGLLYCEDTKINTTSFKKRLCIPVYENGLLSSIEGRKIFSDDPGPKVLYPKNTSVNLLYDIDNLDKDKDLYVCEGLIDLLLLRTCSFFKNSSSIFGACLTKRQIQQLSEFKNVIYIPDNDTAGEGTVNSLKQSELDNISILRLPDSINNTEVKDIGDLPKAGITVEDLYERRWTSHVKKLTN